MTLEHDWEPVRVVGGQHWYRCKVCGKRDWIASYGTLRQLDHGRLCDEQSFENVVRERNELRELVIKLKADIKRLQWMIEEHD